MTDPIFILSYVILFGSIFAFAIVMIWWDRRNTPKKDHPAPGE